MAFLTKGSARNLDLLSSRPRPDERSDDELMALVSAGQRAAFSTLAERHFSALYRFCSKMVGEQALGEELAQDTLLSIWMHRSDYQPRDHFLAYLLTIARRKCLNVRRGFRPAFADDEQRAAEPPQLGQLLGLEEAGRVQAALRRLPDPLRECLLMRFDQGLSYREIAKVVGANEVTCRSRTFYGLRRLKAELGTEAQP